MAPQWACLSFDSFSAATFAPISPTAASPWVVFLFSFQIFGILSRMQPFSPGCLSESVVKLIKWFMLLEVAHLLNYQIVWHVGNVSGGIVVFVAAQDFLWRFDFAAAGGPAIKWLYGVRLEYFQSCLKEIRQEKWAEIERSWSGESKQQNITHPKKMIEK